LSPTPNGVGACGERLIELVDRLETVPDVRELIALTAP
jgi:hypothetical protein